MTETANPTQPLPSIEVYKRRYAAKYTSKGREHKGNVLIEALWRYPRDRKALRAKLSFEPRFTDAMRSWTALKRRLKLPVLARFFWALPRVCELADRMWGVMLQSYSRRKPFTPESTAIMQSMYMRAEDSDRDDEVRWVTALTGIPGAGIRSALAHIANKLFQPLIYHPKLNIWQIPVLKIQMPYHGRHGVSLAIAIIEAVHRVYPFGNYLQVYIRPRIGEPELMAAARHLLFIHYVGFLIVEDAQDTGPEPLANFDEDTKYGKPKKKRTPVTWAAGLLFKAAKATTVPLLLSATSELEDALGQTFDKLQMLHAGGLPHWGPLDFLPPPDKPVAMVDMFLNKLWTLTLLREHPKLDDDMRNMFLYLTFGIPELIVTLYYIVHWRCLQEGHETFDTKYVLKCALTCMPGLAKAAMKMNAVAEGDEDAKLTLARMPDLARELKLVRTIAGVVVMKDPTFSEAKKEASKVRSANGKQPARPKKNSEPRKELDSPVTADVSAMEEN